MSEVIFSLLPPPPPLEDFIGIASEVGKQFVVIGSYYRVIVLLTLRSAM